MTAEVEAADIEVGAARKAVEAAEQGLRSGTRDIGATALHKLRDKWRHAALAAEGAQAKAERERQAARLAGLEEIGQQIDAAAAETEELPAALTAAAEAVARFRQLAAAHDDQITDLITAASDHLVEPAAPGGPRKTSAYVAVSGKAITHKNTQLLPVTERVDAALRAAMAGRLDEALTKIKPVTRLADKPRPNRLLRGANGTLIPISGPLNPVFEQGLRAGSLTELPDSDIDAYLAGELGTGEPE